MTESVLDNTGVSRFEELLAKFDTTVSATKADLKELSNLAMEVFDLHGQLGPLNRLYEVMISHKVFSAKTLVIWCKLYAPISQKKGMFVKNTTNMDEVDQDYNLVNFWDCEPEAPTVDNNFSQSDISKAFDTLINKYDAPEKRAIDRHAKAALRELKAAQANFTETLRKAEAAAYFGKSASELTALVKEADLKVAVSV